MKAFSSEATSNKTAVLFILLLLWACISSVVHGSRRTPSPTKFHPRVKIVRDPHAAQACEEFPERKRSGSGWLFSDCTVMWTAWTRTLEDADFVNCDLRGVFNETASRLRQEGHPCVLDSTQYQDGAGSASVRHLATWMVAEELGCDWVAPKLSSQRIDEDGTQMYCHKTVTVNQLHQTAVSEFHGEIDPANFPERVLRCEVVNWLEYFRFRDHGVNWKDTGGTKKIEVSAVSTFWCFRLVFFLLHRLDTLPPYRRLIPFPQKVSIKIAILKSGCLMTRFITMVIPDRIFNPLARLFQLFVGEMDTVVKALNEYNSYSKGARPWVNWRFHVGKISANRFVQNVPSWDAFKREKVAGVVKRFRDSFHEFPRSW